MEEPFSKSKKDTWKSICNNIEAKLRMMQDSWLSKKADDIQNYADKNDMKNFYDGIKEIYGPTSSGTSPLLSADGSTLITDKDKILERWAEHFENFLNRLSTINHEAIDRLHQVPLNDNLDDLSTIK